MIDDVTRRKFLTHSMAAGIGAGLHSSSKSSQILGANDRIRVGFIGVGNRGSQLLDLFLENPDVQVVALSDVYKPYLYRDRSMVDPGLAAFLGGKIPKMEEKLDKSVGRYEDFRHLLDRNDIDAVVIATPDHWHAIQTIMACDSGKDVYVEKPLTATILEGRKMVEAAERNKSIVQVGLQRRSSKTYREAVREVAGGCIGRITVARTYHVSNMTPGGIGRMPAEEPPDDLDWNAWLGPRAWRPYQENIHPYRFRWWQEYSSQVGNWGVHYFDAIRWLLGEESPVSISAHGGRFVVDDDRTIPDTMEVVFEFESGVILTFGQFESSGGSALPYGEIELRGTLGNLYCSPPYERSTGYRIVPSRGGQFQDPNPRRDAIDKRMDTEYPTADHVRNFLDCVKSREQCICSLEEGHRSTTFAHLANIALETRSRIQWDPSLERITNNEKASQLLHYKYRDPWRLS
jgi:predicted dehydrogenase